MLPPVLSVLHVHLLILVPYLVTGSAPFDRICKYSECIWILQTFNQCGAPNGLDNPNRTISQIGLSRWDTGRVLLSAHTQSHTKNPANWHFKANNRYITFLSFVKNIFWKFKPFVDFEEPKSNPKGTFFFPKIEPNKSKLDQFLDFTKIFRIFDHVLCKSLASVDRIYSPLIAINRRSLPAIRWTYFSISVQLHPIYDHHVTSNMT